MGTEGLITFSSAQLSMSAPQRSLIVVIIAAAALYLIGNNQVGLWDRDEPRYAQMVPSGFPGYAWTNDIDVLLASPAFAERAGGGPSQP
jgi:hypothetical protein